MIESIQQSAKVHDRYQVELKLDYELAEGGDTHYRTFTYIFIPQSLGINADSYQKDDFYRDVKNYIRMKTPVLSLRDLYESKITPFYTVQKILEQPNWYLTRATNQKVLDGLKLMGAMLKSALRDHLDLVERRIMDAPRGSNVQQLVDNLVEEYLAQTKQIATHYRALYAQFNLPHIEKKVFRAYLLVDEYVSLLLEENTTELYIFVDRYFDGEKKANYLKRLNKVIERETSYRLERGYGSVIKVGAENENYAFRGSVLKKFVGSVLHLSIDSQREGRGLEQILYAMAAGISMIVATVIAFYFQDVYGAITFPVFIALVVGYMFKDRIKDLGRALFSRLLQNLLFDRRVNVKTLDGRYRLAVLREKMFFVNEADVPPEILAARNKGLYTELDNETEEEIILCHTKEIVLFGDLFSRAFAHFPKVSGLNDIIRYDLYPFLRKMAEPVEERLVVEDGKLTRAETHKVYHVNIIARYRSTRPRVEQMDKRLRLVLTRDGIKRLETVEL